MNKPYTHKQIDNILNPIVKKWFYKTFKEYSLPQTYGVMEIHSRNNILISAPTGATKTLTGFLSILNELIDNSEKGILEDRIYCVYISPLKALNEDIKINLIRPLEEMEKIAKKKLGIRIGVRTGDTTTSEKAKQLKKPPHILITTPESLAIVLSSVKFIDNLRDAQWCIIDEIHALAENKRGTHLSLSLERLQKIAPAMTRIGLSACLNYNEYITLGSGEIVKIGDFVENLIKIKKIQQGNLEYSPVKGVYVHSTNKAGKIILSKVIKAWRIPAPKKIAEIILQTGKKIRITLNDQFLTLENGKLNWKKVSQFKENEFICIPKHVKTKSIKLNPLKYLINSKNIHTKNPHRLIKQITDNEIKKRGITVKEFSKIVGIPYKKLVHLREGNIDTISLSMLNGLMTSLNKQYPPIEKLCGTTGKHFIKLPKYLDENFMRLFGLIASDGHVSHGIVSFANNNVHLIKEVKELIKLLFDRDSSIRIHSKENKRAHILTFKSIPASYLFRELGLNFGKKSSTMTIHNDLFSLHEKSISAFISGYLDGDGCVNISDQGGYFRIHSYSKEFIEKMYHCFVRLGIHPSIISQKRKNGTLYYIQVTSTTDREKLFQLLKYSGKSQKLRYNIENEKRSNYVPIGDIIKSYKKTNNIEFKKLDKLLGVYSRDIVYRGYCSAFLFEKILKNLSDSSNLKKQLIKVKNFDVGFEKIKKIEIRKNNKRYVYDLSVDKTNNFIASNIIVHNTIAPLEEIARYLVGYDGKNERPCKIVDVQFIKKLDIKVLSPVPDLIDTEHGNMHNAMYDLIHNLIQTHKTTLIFTNTRAATERVVHNLKDKYPKFYSENIGAHHGSLSKEHRHSLENRLREGKIKVAVCSTSLELGIDIGFIDLVICLSSPKSVARALQRIGRSGHKFHEVTKGRIIVLDRDDLVECAVILKSALEKKIDRIHIPTNALDVLAQQIYGIAIQNIIEYNELYKLIRNSYCYHTLSKKDFRDIIDYLTGKYTSLEDRHIYAKIWHDEETNLIGKRGKLARVLYMTNIGTIPDQASVIVKIGTQVIGTIDEAFLEKLRSGDVFVLGGQTYIFKFSRGMVAQVSVSVNRPPTVPSWFSEMLPLSFDLALEIGRFRKLLNEKFCAKKSKKEIIDFINSYVYVDKNAADSIYRYFNEQFNYAEIPSHSRIIVEHYTDDQNRKKVIFHSLYGRRVNDCLSRALAFAISRTQHRDVEIGINDNGFYIASDKSINVMHAFKLIKSKDFRKVLDLAIDKTEIMKRRFRHCAMRALMILRTYKGRTKRVGRQQVSSMILLSALKRISPDFSILREARREVLEDLMDVDSACKVIEGIEKKKVKIEEIHTNIPSPFAFNLVAQGITDILKVEDRVEFLRRMHKNVLAKIGMKKVVQN